MSSDYLSAKQAVDRVVAGGAANADVAKAELTQLIADGRSGARASLRVVFLEESGLHSQTLSDEGEQSVPSWLGDVLLEAAGAHLNQQSLGGICDDAWIEWETGTIATFQSLASGRKQELWSSLHFSRRAVEALMDCLQTGAIPPERFENLVLWCKQHGDQKSCWAAYKSAFPRHHKRHYRKVMDAHKEAHQRRPQGRPGRIPH